MRALFVIGAVDPDYAAWVRWPRDIMGAWSAHLCILLMYAGLMVLLVLQFLLAGTRLGVVDWPTGLFVIEFVLLCALWLGAFVRLMTRQRSGPGDDEVRERGAALERVVESPPAEQP